MERQPLWEMRGITKRFPGVIANENVALTLYPGEVHALLGELLHLPQNGVIHGVVHPRAGD